MKSFFVSMLLLLLLPAICAGYTVSDGLSLATADTRYLNAAGDEATGPISVPDATADGHAVSRVFADGRYAQKQIIAPVDLNDATDSGFYRLGTGHLNAPASVDYGQMIVSRGWDTILQIVTGYNGNPIYFRNGSGIPPAGGPVIFSDWNKFYTSGNDGAGSGLAADLPASGIYGGHIWAGCATSSSLPAGWTIAKQATGECRVTHNLNNYGHVLANVNEADPAAQGVASVSSQLSWFQVNTKNLSGVAADRGFRFLWIAQ